MTLTSGTKLGPYEVLAPLGAGGMGEVYRARDARLGRDVAVKVLPQHLSSNPEVRARFEREAKTVSGLNHPNICTLFDVGREGDTDYLVMELVEGETLAARLARGPLPASDVLRFGVGIADALDRAHRAGVVHRDLKPGNVMLTKSGPKLMDFGLARAVDIAGPASGSFSALTQSPTVAQPLTAEGTIVGTFQYMSPEQLEGREADARSDLWALGCVLYEMTTGTRAFQGKSQASLITSIMSSEPPPISQVAPMAPPALDRVVRQCLAKDPTDRIQTAHDVKLHLSWIADAGSQINVAAPLVTPRRARSGVRRAVVAAALLAAGFAIAWTLRPRPSLLPVQAAIQPPKGVLFSSSTDQPLPLAISHDGTTIAFCARDGEGPDLLWVRSLASEDARPLPGTEGAEGPFFSPDGRSLAFFADTRLKRVDVAGGPVITLASNIDPRGGSWNEDNVILFTGSSTGPVSKVPADGGAVEVATTLDSTVAESTHRYPYFLPDGKHFLYLARRAGAGSGENPTVFVGELGSDKRTAVLQVASNVIYANGYLLYARSNVLVAQRFDTKSLAVSGSAIPVVDDLRVDERFSRSVFAASATGVLVCMTGAAQTRTQLRWIDRAGKTLRDVGDPADYTYGGTPEISPDGRSAAMPIANRDRGISDIWIIDLESGRRRKLALDTNDHPGVAWLPDGKSVAVASPDDGSILRYWIDGTQSQKIVATKGYAWPLSAWGDYLLFGPDGGLTMTTDLMVVPWRGGGTASPLVASKALEDMGKFSPDGRWVAHVSDETGRVEVFVSSSRPGAGRWQVSQNGGLEPRWNRNGRELLYVDRENYIVSVVVNPSAGGFEFGASQHLFQFHGAGGNWRYDIAPNGESFLVTAPLPDDLTSPVTLITDWTRKVEGH